LRGGTRLSNSGDILEVNKLSKSFDGVKAVNNVSFSVKEGTITTIIGPNGAGKTSLFNVICGYLRQDSGEILLESMLQLLHRLLMPSTRKELDKSWNEFVSVTEARKNVKVDGKPWLRFLSHHPWQYISKPFDDNYVGALKEFRYALLQDRTLISIDDISPSERAELGLGRLWQDIRLFKNMTLLENLMVARKDQEGEGVLNNFLRRGNVRRSESETREKAIEILKSIRLEEKQNSSAQDLSYGQQKLVALGRLLINDAELLLLDEPTAGVNPVMIDEILEVIAGLAESGKTILMIEHNIPKALRISDWVYVMDAGRIELSGTPSDVRKDPELREVYLSV